MGPATREHRHSLKLEKRDCKSRIRANFFGYRIVINIQNSLPDMFIRLFVNRQLSEMYQRKT